MKKLEQLRVIHDLFWACKQDKGLDKLFQDADFMDRFTEFQSTDGFEQWKLTEEYRIFLEWNG